MLGGEGRTWEMQKFSTELSAQVVYQNTDWVLRGATQEEISNKESKLTINADRKFNDYSIFDYEGNLSALSI